MLSLLAFSQAANPWVELSRIGQDARLGPIWDQLAVSSEPGGPRPATMPVYREIAQRSGRLKDVLALCAGAAPPPAPSPLANDVAYTNFLRGIKVAYRSLVAVATVEFYDGRAMVGTKMLRDGLQASYRLQSSSTLGGLVGIANQSVVLGEIEKRLGRISLADLEEFEKSSRALLANKPPYLEAVERDRALSASGFNDWWRDPWPGMAARGWKADEVAALRRQWEAVPGNAKESEANQIREGIDREYRAVLDHFNKAEALWPKPDPEEKTPPSSGFAGAFKPYLPLVPTMALISPVSKSWTQLRLLRLHAQIRAFRWRQDRWPRSLGEASGGNVSDPIANKPFTYRLEGGSYLLRSEGWPGMGPIELRYRNSGKGDGTEAGA